MKSRHRCSHDSIVKLDASRSDKVVLKTALRDIDVRVEKDFLIESERNAVSFMLYQR